MVYLDKVHSCHRKTGSIDHAADITIESDLIQSMLRGFNLLPISLPLILEDEQLSLTVFSIVIDVYLLIADDNIPCDRDT